MTKTNIKIATSKENLLSILSSLDMSVPPIGMGRTKEHVERWSICKLLSTLANQNQLTYPLQLIHNDRPDFLIKFTNERVGIEFTEARNRNQAHYEAILNREFPDKIYSPSLFQLGEPEMSKSEMLADLGQDALSGAPLMGDKPEIDWAEYIKDTIQAKLLGLAKPEFKKFDKNWLLMYVAIPFTQVNINVALTYLEPYLPKIFANNVTFDTIYIEHINQIIKICPSELVNMEIHQIW